MLRNVITPVFESAIYHAIASVFDKRIYGGTAPFSPVSLFTGGYVGAWYDPSDLSTLWQDSARTTPVTADGDPVGCIDDKSGNGNHLTQATSGKRPVYRASGGLHWLQGDGIADSTSTASIDLTATDKVSVFTSTKFDNTTSGVLCEFSPLTTANAGSFEYLNLSGAPCFYGRGNSTFGQRTTSTTAGHTSSCAYDIGASSGALELIPRKDGALFSPRTTDSGTTLGSGNFGNYSLYVLARNNASLFLNGRMYGLLVVNRTCTSTEFDDMDAYHATKAGI